MPQLTFDDNGWPIWTNGPDGSGTDPEPLSAAIAAVNSIGQPGGVPYPQNLPEMNPGAIPQGAPPAETKANALINPENDSYEYPPGPEQLAAPQPAFGTTPGLADFDPAAVMSGPAPGYGVPASSVPPAEEQGIQNPIPRATPAAKAPPPGRMDPYTAANAALDTSQTQAAQAAYDQAVAQNEATRQLTDRKAQAMEERNRAQAAADQQFQMARDQAQKTADMETAKWMADMEEQAKKEPNPKRWFANQSSFGKGLWLLSLAFGTKAAATAPGVQNIAIAMIREEMDKDMAEQKARLAREMQVLERRGGVIDKRTAQRLANLRDDHTIRAGQLLAMEKAALERANAPGSADDQAAMAAAHTWLAQQRMATAATRAQQAFQAKESQLARGHAAWMQKQNQQWQSTEKAIDRAEAAARDALNYAAKVSEASAKNDAASKKAAAEAAANTFQLDPRASGVTVMKDGKAVPLTLLNSNEREAKKVEQVTNLANAAQEVSAELQLIKRALADGSFAERILGTDTTLQSAVVRLGYSKAKENDPRGIVTNADFMSGIVSAMGMKYDTATGRFMQEAKWSAVGKTPSEELAKAIDKELAVVESRTNAKLNTYVSQTEGGGKIQWRAANRNPLESQVETLDQMTTRVTGKSQDESFFRGGIDQPTTMSDLEEAQKLEKAGAKNALPHYQRREDGSSTADVVNEARTAFGSKAGFSPERIRVLAEGYEAQVAGDNRARLEVLQAADAAAKVAAQREDQVKKNLIVRQAHKGSVTLDDVQNELKREGLGAMREDGDYMQDILRAVEAVSPYSGLPKKPK